MRFEMKRFIACLTPLLLLHGAKVIAMTNTNSCDASIRVINSDNLEYLKSMPSGVIDLIYIDPPFNTRRKQMRKRFHTLNSIKVAESSFGYNDSFDNLIEFLEPRIKEAYRILKPTGSRLLSLGENHLSMKLSGHMIMALARQINGAQNMITFFGTQKTHAAIPLITMLWIAYRTWLLRLSDPKRQHAGKRQLMFGGTQ